MVTEKPKKRIPLMPEGDLTNKALSKIFSVETGAVLLAGGIAWGTLSGDVSAVVDDVKEHSVRHANEILSVREDAHETANEVQKIKVELSKISNNQEHFKDDLKELTDSQKEILDILRENYPNHE